MKTQTKSPVAGPESHEEAQPKIATTVNYHFWIPCNMRCKYCFATFHDVTEFLPSGYLTKEESLQLIGELAILKSRGLRKITFSGGEPTLCSWLPELIGAAKSIGLITNIVTNGSKFISDPEYLERIAPITDIITVSIDSLDGDINKAIGRRTNGAGFIRSQYVSICDLIKSHGIILKINTVVSSCNFMDNHSDFIEEMGPVRWKVMQALKVEGQNDGGYEEIHCNDEQFDQYISSNGTNIRTVIEGNHIMRGSYLMIDPAGRFFDSAKGHHTYSDPILQVGLEKALKQIHFDMVKFLERDGHIILPA